MSGFGILDWSVVAAYFLLVTLISHHTSARQVNVGEYFLGSRSLPWYAVAASIVSTSVSGVTFIGVPAIVFADGDGVAPTVTGIGGTTATEFEVGETITFGAGADVITDFSVSLDFISGMDAALVPTAGLEVALGSTTGYAAGTTYYFSGAYVKSTGIFTLAANGAGADTLILEGSGASPTVSTDYVILVGIDSDNLLATNFIA